MEAAMNNWKFRNQRILVRTLVNYSKCLTMDSPKVFLLILSFWGIVFSARTEHSMADTWTRDQTSRSLLQSGIPSSCNVESNVRWYDDPPAPAPGITSAAACCELCQQTPGCRAWVWTTIGQNCYLLDTVGDERFCSFCTGGTLDVEPPSSPSIEEFLQNCANEGAQAARAPAITACIFLTSACAPAAPEEPQAKSASSVQSSPTRGDIVREQSCDALFTQACGSRARNLASSVNPACAAILERGPRESRAGCEDLAAATDIFNDQLAELCDPSDD